MTEYIQIPNPIEDEEPEYIRLVAKFEICHVCHGKGKTSNYLGAFTQEDRDELSPEWFEDYMNGEFDRACDECKGDRVIKVVDRENNSPELLNAYDRWEEEEFNYRRLEQMENAAMNWMETRGY